MSEFDVIVVGSGMGGMTTAAALSRLEHKVLLLGTACGGKPTPTRPVGQAAAPVASSNGC